MLRREAVAPPLRQGAPAPQFTVERVVAVDGSGILVDARGQRDGGDITVRVAPAETAPDRALRHRLQQMNPALVLTRHPNLVSVTALEPNGGFIAYEPVQGPSLARVIALNGALDLDAALALFHDCLSGLEALHEAGITHGNLSPDALVIERAGVVLLRDAGLEHTAGDDRTGGAWRRVPAGTRDLPAATMLFQQVLTGTASQWGGAGAGHHRPPLPDALQRLVHRGLNTAAEKRPEDAATLRGAAETVATSLYGDGWLKLGRAKLAGAAAVGAGRASLAGDPGERVAAAMAWLGRSNAPTRTRPLVAAGATVGVVTVALLAIGLTGTPASKVSTPAQHGSSSLGGGPIAPPDTPAGGDGGGLPAPGSGNSGIQPVPPAFIPGLFQPGNGGGGGAPGAPKPSGSGVAAITGVSMARSTVTASPTQMNVCGAGTPGASCPSARITVTLIAQGGAPLAGKIVILKASDGSTSNPIATGADGSVTFNVFSYAAGPLTYTATDTTDGVQLTSQPTVTYFTTPPPPTPTPTPTPTPPPPTPTPTPPPPTPTPTPGPTP